MTGARSFGITPPAYRLPVETRLGPIHLQVADLSRSAAYYRDVLGLRVFTSEGGISQLGATPAAAGTATSARRTLIVLHEHPGAAPVVPRKRFGLFHLAILLPTRAALGQLLMHLVARHEPAGMSDHAVSEAIYLTDPDGHGLEIYADRPRNLWQSHDQQLTMASEPLDARAVMADAHGDAWREAPEGTIIGHVHLHVGALDEAARFYHDALGFDKTVWDYPGALFLAAGGYHHHVGINTWARNGVAPPPTEARLLEWTIELPTRSDIAALASSCATHHVPYTWDADSLVLHDPWGTAVRISPIMSP